MAIEVAKIDPNYPDPNLLYRAGEIIRDGGLVCFPTETVYGLGGNALDPRAVQKIYDAKGRPAVNPVIVHVDGIKQAGKLSQNWSGIAGRLAVKFWPGPLTLVIERNQEIPDIVTAGKETVGLRCPAHMIARALVQRSGVPIAAPSANRSNSISPTRVEHVLRSFKSGIDLILDAGPTWGGIESTVIDTTVSPPRVLRPGLVKLGELREVIGHVDVIGPEHAASSSSARSSPGMMDRHYAPNALLTICQVDGSSEVRDALDQGQKVGWMTWPATEEIPSSSVVRRDMPLDVDEYASVLYDSLHHMDAEQVDRIYVARPPIEENWLGIWDRLKRASHRA